MSHPLTAPEGLRTKTTAQGLSVHTRNTGLDYTGLKYDSSQEEGVEEGPPLLFFTNAHTHTHSVPATMATSQAQREDLVVPHTCQKQMLRINQRGAENEEKLHTGRNSTNSLHSTLTGEQTAAHDNTHQ